MKKTIWAGLAASALLWSAPSQAAVYTYTTTGCFTSTSCAPGSYSTNASTGGALQGEGGLSFKGAGSTAHPVSNSGPTLNLGTMSLQNILFDDPKATTFDLKVSFTSPLSSSSIFTADLVGLIVFGFGYVKIDFDNSVQKIGTGPNAFGLSIDDIYLYALDGREPITGHLGPAPIAGAVPEPSTWAMMMLGFGSLGFMAYRRRRNAVALQA